MSFGNGAIFDFIFGKIALLGTQDPFAVTSFIFWHGLWIIFLGAFIYAIYDVWLDGRQGMYVSKWKFVLLAIDIPKNNEQTPKAVENIFSTIAGAHTNFNLIDVYWTGKILDSFS